MSASFDDIAELSQQLQQLQRRLTELDAEKVTIQRQIDDYVARIAAATAWQVRPPHTASMSRLVLWVLRRHAGHPLSPMDIANILQLRSFSDVATVRLALSRMARAGKVRKLGHGRYAGIDPSKPR